MGMHNLRPAEWCVIVGPYTQRHHHPTDLSTPDRSASPGILLEACLSVMALLGNGATGAGFPKCTA
jgi:hypothetical protein